MLIKLYSSDGLPLKGEADDGSKRLVGIRPSRRLLQILMLFSAISTSPRILSVEFILLGKEAGLQSNILIKILVMKVVIMKKKLARRFVTS